MFSKLTIPTLSLVFLCSACESSQHYNYKHKDGEYIQLDLYETKQDRFKMESSVLDFDGNSIELEYSGEFIKDSVDQAVGRYIDYGIIPRKNDLF